ncbi:MAG: dihydroorotate dehydrogenase [Candidatus Thermoplasmatota archaeon]|nr:dihydroorotate dehydrogenase [Candidatus Thermoplasmatota archaeon]
MSPLIDLTTKISSLKLKNPTILASGIMDEDVGSMKRIAGSGAGAIVTKSIGLKPREGYPNPTIVELECGVLNAMGLPSPGIKEYGEEIKNFKKIKVPLIGSIFGSNSKEFVELGRKMQEYGTDALELNMSCPHARGYGLEIGSDPVLVKKITYDVKQSVDIPVFVKLSSNVSDLKDIARAVEKGGADGVVAINTVKAMKINLELKKPVLANKIGGYSGKAIKPIGVRCVYEIAETVDIPVIGVGGITTGEDALEYIMAGASAVQIGTGIYYRDLDVFRKICGEIEGWMKKHGVKRLSDLVGVAHI